MEINNLMNMDLIIVIGTLNEIIKLSNISKSIVVNVQTFCNRSGLYATNILAYEKYTHHIAFFFFSEQVLYFIRLVLCNMFETIVRTIT